MSKNERAAFEKAVGEEYSRMLHQVAQGAATELGALPDAVTLSQKDEQERWDYRRPDVTPEMLPVIAQEIATKIVTAYQQSGKSLPDQQTLTNLVAAQVSRVHTGGMRRELVSRGFPDPMAQTKRAEGFKRREARAPGAAVAAAGIPEDESKDAAPAAQEGAY